MGSTGAQVFGYVGAITEDEYHTRKNEGYSPNDVVGKDGLEQTYDTWLRGRLGGQQIEVVLIAGVLVRRLKPVDPIPGNTLVTTIDHARHAAHRRQGSARRARPARKSARTPGCRRSRRARPVYRRRAGAGVVSDLRSERLRDADQRAQVCALHRRPAAAPLQPRDRRGVADRLDVQDGHGFRCHIVRRDRQGSNPLRHGLVELPRRGVQRHRFGRTG